MSPQRGMKRANSTGKARNSVKPGKTTKSKEQPAAKKAGHTGEAKKSGATAALPSIQVRIAEAKKLETLDRAKVSAAPAKPAKARAMQPASAAVSAASSLRNSDFPNTYISQISVRLDDPDHSVALTWTGPQAAAQETGPFRSSPGAGLKGLNCDDTATSRRSGSKCTPKGTFVVSGFQGHLNSDSRATYVTWFVRARGIGLHYFPSVPKYSASHGCVRLESERVAQLIQSNSRVDLTNVVIDGTWTKPPKQW
jgi:L,D-transpeptidase catalytic domain